MDTQYFFDRPTTCSFLALRPQAGAGGVLESDGTTASSFPLVSGFAASQER